MNIIELAENLKAGQTLMAVFDGGRIETFTSSKDYEAACKDKDKPHVLIKAQFKGALYRPISK